MDGSYWAVIGAVATLFGIIGGLAAAFWFIDSRIKAALGDPDVLKKIASALYPSMIFDSTGAVLANYGAMGLITKFEVDGDISDIREVVIDFKEFRAAPPLIFILSPWAYSIVTTRGPGTEWRFAFGGGCGFDPGGEPQPLKFRLELI